MAKVIKHIGTKRHSGRYPWGSGGHGKQHSKDFLKYVDELKNEGLSETEIAKAMGMKTTELRQLKSIEKNRLHAEEVAKAVRFKEEGMSNVAIGERMGKNESSVRELLKESSLQKAKITDNLVEMLKTNVEEKGVIDIGLGVEAHIGVSRNKFLTAIRAAELEGYQRMYVRTKQLGTGKYTSIMVLAPPGMEYKDVYAKRHEIGTITDHTTDGGRTILGLKPVQSVDGKRILVRYAGEGGADKDGTIELRRGVNDLDLGDSKYAQVRVGVDGTHYMKGMAVYSDNIPNGFDIVYNTSKPAGTPRSDVFKKMKLDADTGEVDDDNPFGATISRQKGALNIMNEEGDWSTWSRNLSSQFLSKQQPTLAKKQLELAKDLKQAEFDEIMALTNPAVKQHMLMSFADSADSSAVHLKAAALPRQSTHVLLPVPSLKPKEVYAPMFENGEQLVLVRHPHGGIFEIPEVVVNNRNPEAKSIMGNARDAIGIHPDVAQKLSGADFDGDHVIAIPNRTGNVKASQSLTALKDFDPRTTYPKFDGMKTIDGGYYNEATGEVDYRGKKPSGRTKQLEMGNVSNLITDMTIKGASQAEIARAVKHSMVVIDAEKHVLNYKQSAIDNDIAGLKEKYQGGPNAGAATLVSRASSQERVPHRTEGVYVTNPKTGKKRKIYIDPKTGEKLYTETGEQYTDKRGKVQLKQTISTKMAEAKSAFDLSSGTKMEAIYAEYADDLKAMGNKARKEALATPNMKYNREAYKTYKKEAESIKRKLLLSDQNKPKERQAQLVADKIYRAKLKAHPELDASDKKRLRGQALAAARARLGAEKPKLEITDREWTAIQMGAVSHNTVVRLLKATPTDYLKEKATPRTAYKMTPTKVSKAKAMAAAGYTPAEIASALGVSATTIADTINN